MTLCDYCRKANKTCPVYPRETLKCAEFTDSREARKRALDNLGVELVLAPALSNRVVELEAEVRRLKDENEFMLRLLNERGKDAAAVVRVGALGLQRFMAALPCGYSTENPESLVRDSSGDYVLYADANTEIQKLRAALEKYRGQVNQYGEHTADYDLTTN